MNWKKWLLVVVLMLGIGLFISYSILKENNKYVRYWDQLPDSVQQRAIKLEIDRVKHFIFTPEPDQTILDGITKEKLMQSIISGADWILNMQESSGRFNYWYDPGANEFSPVYDDNFLRQAGTAYSLTLVYEVTNDSAYLEAARKNIEYLTRYKRIRNKDTAYFLYKRKAKLGGIALPMLAMIKIKQLTRDTVYDDDLKKLANMILYLQNIYGTGQYKSTYIYQGNYHHEKTTGWESNIYPGEAMLALAFMYKTFGDEKYLESIEKAFDFYEPKRKWWHNTAFIPWTVSAFSELYLITGNKKYADFVFKMCNSSLRRQNLNPERLVYGSFDGLPTVFTSTTFEGIGDAIPVAEKIGDKSLKKKYIQRSKLAYHWLMKLQFKADGVKEHPSPAIGGFKRSLQESKIRIDNTQHAISAMIRGVKYMDWEKE